MFAESLPVDIRNMNGASYLPKLSRRRKLPQMFEIIIQTMRWLFTWLYFVLVICFLGAMLGVLSHTAFGLFFMDQPDRGYLAAFGFKNGLRYGSVWAGGLAIVLCVIRARKEYLAKHPKEGALG